MVFWKSFPFSFPNPSPGLAGLETVVLRREGRECGSAAQCAGPAARHATRSHLGGIWDLGGGAIYSLWILWSKQDFATENDKMLIVDFPAINGDVPYSCVSLPEGQDGKGWKRMGNDGKGCFIFTFFSGNGSVYSSKDRDWDLELVNSHSVYTCLEGMWSTRGWEVGWNPLSMILGDVDLHDGKGVKHPKKAGKLDWNSDKIWQDLTRSGGFNATTNQRWLRG